MRGISKLLRTGAYIIATAALGAGITVSNSKAAVIDLGFALDASGSVGQGNFNTVRTALSTALGAIPFGGPDTYRVSVVVFSDLAQNVHTSVIDLQAALTALQTAVAATPYAGGLTCISCATTLLTQNITNVFGGFGNSSLINITTDGEPNVGELNGATLRLATVGAGWDSISAEAIGGFDLAFLQSLVSPNPGVTTADPGALPDPLVQGFVLTVTNFDGYAAAIDAKVANIIDPGQTPIPGALPLFATGLGAIGFLTWRRKRNVAQAS